MNITLEQAFSILESCSAVVIDNVVTYPTMQSLVDREEGTDHVFLTLQWDTERGQPFEVNFRQGDQSDTVKVEGSSLWLTDDAGDERQISILVPAKLT